MTLTQLEKKDWGEPTYSSNLVKTCHALRHKVLRCFTAEDCRIMINQQIGLLYLVPIAINILNKNILTAGDLYEGDLLESVLRISDEHWKNNLQQHKDVKFILKRGKQKIRQTPFLCEEEKSNHLNRMSKIIQLYKR